MTVRTASALERRSRVVTRRPLVARHTHRVLKRTLVLAIGDFFAVLAVRWVMRAIVAGPYVIQGVARETVTIGPFADPGRPGSLVFPTTLVVALVITGSYSRHRRLNTSVRLGAAAFIAAAATAVALAAVVGVPGALLQGLLAAAPTWVALTLGRVLSERVASRAWPGDRGRATAVLVGSRESFSSAAGRAISATGSDFRVVPLESTQRSRDPHEAQRLLAELQAVVERHEADVIVICEELLSTEMRAVVELALESGCRVLYPARLTGIEEPRPRLVWYFDQPFFELGAVALKATAVTLKRVTDVIGASLLLILVWPVMLVIAAGVKLDSPGPALFSQHRAGLGGRSFRMLKFRTMRHGADSEKARLNHLNRTGDVRLFKIPSDPRTTRFGRFLRRWSLDELPQLVNVLRGDMSLVGPRPFFESDFAAYEDSHFRRLDTKPGITGLWQVSGRSEVLNFEDVVFLDRQYIEQWSFWLDVSILFRTIPAVMRRTGAY